VKKVHKMMALAALASTTVMAPFSASASTSFADLNKAATWAQASILKAKETGIMKGDTDGNFRPLDTITRREAATILTKLLQLPVEETVTSSFVDVKSSDWGSKYIEAVKHAGLMSGDGKTFRPNAPITREELAVILVKAAKEDVTGKGSNLTVADRHVVSTWAKPYVQAAMEMGLLRGDGKNFNPKKSAQRQEVAVMAMNLSNVLSTVPQKPPVTAQTSVLEKVEGTSVTISGQTYQVADNLRGILNEKNQQVLRNAKINVSVEGNTVKKITYLELVQPGSASTKEFSGNLVLDGANGAIDGDVKVKANYISLTNLVVNGNLEIGKELENDFYSKNVKVTGKTIVNGGDANTVVFENGNLSTVDVNKNGVHVTVKGTTKVAEVAFNTNAALTGDKTASVSKVIVKDGASSLELNANVPTMVITSANALTLSGQASIGTMTVEKAASLTLSAGTKVENVNLPAGKKAEDIIQNFSNVKDQIANVNGQKNNGANPVPGAGGGGVVTDTTAPVMEEASATIGGEKIVAARSGNTFTVSLAGRNNHDMFTALHLNVSEDASITFNLKGIYQVEKELKKGANTLFVSDLLGSLDSGEPGVSVSTVKNLLSEISGELKDKAGNQTTITIKLQ
jgi:hypothetical protein